MHAPKWKNLIVNLCNKWVGLSKHDASWRDTSNHAQLAMASIDKPCCLCTEMVKDKIPPLPPVLPGLPWQRVEYSSINYFQRLWAGKQTHHGLKRSLWSLEDCSSFKETCLFKDNLQNYPPPSLQSLWLTPPLNVWTRNNTVVVKLNFPFFYCTVDISTCALDHSYLINWTHNWLVTKNRQAANHGSLDKPSGQ